jgi:uncharacterized protein (UPF0261 family)
MPADHASGRFALLMNAMSRKAFPLGTTAALSLLISTAAHADQCVYVKTSDVMVVAQATTVSPANACILDEGTMRRSSDACGSSGRRQPAPDVAALPTQQSAAR